ncbi:NAD/NADP octopine/nopaline dehydrogenase family protein (plasmid) [Rhizobium sp. B230/85]|uniref:NAD/NADP-dependent octopine/nopaline dehydrogenase family protein n=1 Tax=unclassified Rhizobium TaxID=2613769 RepID=UPI001ADCA27E|nr:MULTISPECIES: NAD/NADP octopine/nopaline dehydrogenase family protein [unclassified Rhizobium]MBO9136526.1 NAD/NADP octopine/nopaline dehydrogenase family protein [Rhizobium sp. B209b/85]QXZ99714.1 NAD/NADP octopine/nopaline dehydrogenase family protein [Rhizobium sp. B230/85]
MNVAIAGAGAIAIGYAALLHQNGHHARIWSPSGRRTEELNQDTPLQVSGALSAKFNPGVCQRADELTECDVVVLALPAYGHRFVLDSLVPHLTSRHTVIISAHLSFAGFYLAQKLAEREIEIPIVVWNTTVLTAKAQSGHDIEIGAIRGKVDMALVHAADAQKAHELCTDLFGDRFDVKDDIVTITLSNINPESHLGTALCNLTRIELGETWGQRVTMTPAVSRFIEALDCERLAIAAAFGKTVPSILDHFSKSFGITATSLAALSQILVAKGNDPAGPRDINTRYVLEDVPFGLIPILELAALAKVDAPLHRSGVEILSACYGRNFATDNDILPQLQLSTLVQPMTLK